MSEAFFMVYCDINQSQHCSAPNESYVAGKSKQDLLNYRARLREVIDLWDLIICLSAHSYIHVSRRVKGSERSTARNMVPLTALIRIRIGLKLGGGLSAAR